MRDTRDCSAGRSQVSGSMDIIERTSSSLVHPGRTVCPEPRKRLVRKVEAPLYRSIYYDCQDGWPARACRYRVSLSLFLLRNQAGTLRFVIKYSNK